MRRLRTPAFVTAALAIGLSSGCTDDEDGGSEAADTSDGDAEAGDPGSGPSGPGEEAEAGDSAEDSSGNDSADSDADTGESDDASESSTGGAAGPCDDIVPTGGFGIGDVVPDVELMDQDGNLVSLHDYCEDEVFLFSAAFW